MRFDPNKFVDIRRLSSSVFKAHDALDGFRENRRDAVNEYAGSYYSSKPSSTSTHMPVNMLALMVDIYQMYLAGDSPQVMLSTNNKELKVAAADWEAIINSEIKDIQLDDTIRRWVLEAIFGLGVLKCGLVDSEYIELLPGTPVPTQEYYCDVIDLDDFAYDTSAPSFSKAAWVADRYRVDKDALEDAGYDKSAVREALSSESETISYTDGNRASHVGMPETEDFANNKEEYLVDQVEVWDVWIPEKQLIVTIPNKKECTRPLRVVDWVGPSRGPYHFLSFLDVPGNAMPLAPAQLMRSMNKSINAIFRKLVAQANRQKTVTAVLNSSVKDGNAIRKARDGDMITVDDVNGVHEIKFGGPAPENLAFGLQLDQMFSRLAGNLDAMGGLGAQADTAAQEQMIGSAASKKAGKMARAVVDRTVEVIEDMLFYLWSDPHRVYTGTRPILGTELQEPVRIEPSDRIGDMAEFTVKVEPYSMQYRGPQQKVQEVVNLINLTAPLLPYFQQQGMQINSTKLYSLLAKYLSMPEINEIFETTGMPMPQSSGDDAKQSPVTHRTNERISRSAGSPSANQQNMVSQLMAAAGGGRQNGQ